jgi:hypothetical protein
MKLPHARIPKTGDALVDHFFSTLVSMFGREVTRIGWVVNLRNSKGSRHRNDGLFVFVKDKYRIFLDDDLQMRPLFAARVLLHELIHCLMTIEGREREERAVLAFERILWHRLSLAQKRYLMKLLPPFSRYFPQPR